VAETRGGHIGEMWGCAVSPDGTSILSASDDGTLKIWDAASGAERATLTGHTDDVRGCAVSPDGTWIVSGSVDCTLRVWDAVTGEQRWVAGRPPVDAQPPPGPGSDGSFEEAPNALGNRRSLHRPPVRSSSRGSFEDAPDVQRDPVDCTVFSPPEVQAGGSLFVQVYAHMPSDADEARVMAREFDAEAERSGFTSLGTEIPRGATLTFEFSIPGLAIEDAVQRMTWLGRTESSSRLRCLRITRPRRSSRRSPCGRKRSR
jgi:hypothetical protein